MIIRQIEEKEAGGICIWLGVATRLMEPFKRLTSVPQMISLYWPVDTCRHPSWQAGMLLTVVS